MTRPYSDDLRERALARFETGETVRSIGETLGISASCVSKWPRRKSETGSLWRGAGSVSNASIAELLDPARYEVRLSV